ncbi:MAG: VCBS repeat-containing protein, partial [Candidatus Aenigmatarchaeota archaeon]
MAGSWWDTGWRYSKEISFDISNSSGIAKTELVHFNVTLEPNTTMNCSKELRLTVRGGWCDQNNTCKPTLDEWRRKEITWVKSGKQNNDQYWKYYITNSEPEGWKSTSLDDSGWNQGKTPIGDHNGYRTPWDQDSSSVLVRNSTILNISSLSKVVSAILKVSSDEQAGCWLNEESIFFDFGGGHPDSNWNYVYNIAPRLNLTGKNTLACKVYNINGEQYFDAEITLIVNEWQNTTALTYDPDALENEVPLRVDGEAYSGGYCVAANLTAEVQIYEELGPNLALGKSTLCSGAYSSIYNCSRINDDSYKEEYNNTNQTYDFWMLPNSQTGWARLNLSNNMTINRIRWMNYHDGDSYDAYTTNWAVKTSMSNDTGYSNVQSGVASYKDSYFWTDISFPSRTAQYVQFDVNGYSTRGGLTELQVYNAEIGTRNYRLYYGNPSANKTELRFDSLIATVRNGNPSHVNFTEDYGNGTFKNVMTNIDNISSSTRSVGVADFDNDGDLDIIAADGSCNMYMYLNNGSNVFNDRASLGSFGCNGAPNDIAIGDFNGDGKTDFVTSSDQYNYIYYWENHGNFMFTSNSMPAADWWNSWAKLCGQDDRFLSYPRGKGAADFDNDGDLDVMVLIENYGNSNGRSCMLFALYKNDGKGSFTKEYVSPNYGSGSNMDSHNLIVGEFTGDGNADFIFENGVNNGAGNNGILYLVNGYGNGTFNTSYSEVTRLGERSGGDAYDFDFDGKQDLIVVNYTDALQNGTIHYYRGLGNWSFIGPYNTTNFTRSLAIGGPHFMESRSNVTTGPIRRMTVEGTADALSNGSIIINYQGENWTVPARWEWEWNQTDMMIAGEEYAHHRKIYYNTSFNFTEQPYFNITGWVVNGSALWNGANFSGNLTQPILLNETTIAAKGNDTLWDEGMPKGIPVGKASIGRRQDSAFTTTVNGNAYIIQYFNITNNASSLPANFTNIIVKEGCNANWTCTGFSKIIDSAETTTGWSYDNDANPPATGGLRRVDSYSLNFSWENNDPTTVVAKNFKSSANLGNLTDFQNGNMSMWVFVDSYASFDSIKVIIGSDESNKKGWRRLNTTFSNGWNYLIIDLNSTPSSSSGTINWTNINYLEFTIEGTSYGPDFILIDDWRIWNLGTKEIRIASLNTNEAKLEYGLAKNSNVIATVTEGSNDWRQDTSKTTTAGGTAYIEGNLKINNTDTIKYENVTLLANQSGLSRINWNCYHAGREIYYILTTNTSSDYPIKCSKNAVVTKSEGPWQQSGTATLNSQTINKSVAVENTDPAVSYNNIAWSVNQESACGWSSSTLGGTTNLAANGSAVLEARQSGDCVVNVQSSWKQYMVVESDETGQYIHQNLTIINNANTGMNLTLYASDFSNPTNAFTPVGPYSDPSDYNSPVAIGASQTAVKRQVRSGDVLTQTNGAASEGQTYERLVNVTCSDACDKLSYVKISAGVNDTNYTDFKIYRKNGGIWSFMATPSVSSGTATWYATAFGAVEEYKIWGNSTGVQPPQPAPETPSVNIMSPNSQTYSTGSIWANVTTNISVESCAYSLNG